MDEKRVKAFADEKAAELLKVLKDIKGKKPELEDDGNRAVFKFEKEVVKGLKQIRFQKVEKRWTLLNN